MIASCPSLDRNVLRLILSIFQRKTSIERWETSYRTMSTCPLLLIPIVATWFTIWTQHKYQLASLFVFLEFLAGGNHSSLQVERICSAQDSGYRPTINFSSIQSTTDSWVAHSFNHKGIEPLFLNNSQAYSKYLLFHHFCLIRNHRRIITDMYRAICSHVTGRFFRNIWWSAPMKMDYKSTISFLP